MVNTRAILWFDIVFGFLPGQYNRFRCHSFTIRDVLALKVFVRLHSHFLSFSPASPSWPARLSRRPSDPLGSRKWLSRLQFTHSYQMFQCSLSCVRYRGPKGGHRHMPPLNCYLVNDQPPISRVVQTAIVHSCHCLQGILLQPLGFEFNFNFLHKNTV